MQAVLVYRERITDSGNPTLDKTPFNGEYYMLSLIAAELKRNFGVNLSIDKVHTESWIFKKSWNLPSNFPDLEKVWKMEKKSGKMVNDGLEFFFKATTSALEVNLFRFVQILFIQINPYVL